MKINYLILTFFFGINLSIANSPFDLGSFDPEDQEFLKDSNVQVMVQSVEKAADLYISKQDYDRAAQLLGDILWDWDNQDTVYHILLKKAMTLSQIQTIEDSIAWRLDFVLGNYFQNLEKYDSADLYYAQSLSKGQFMPDSIKGTLFYRWGHTQRRLGDFQKAINLTEEGIRYNMAAYGPIHTLVASGYNNLATYQRAMGLNDASGENYQKALEIRKKIYGVFSNEYARVLNNASTHFLESGDLSTALKYALQTIKIFESLKQPDQRFQVASYNTLADVYSNLGDLNAAKLNFEKALSLHKKYFPDNPRIRFYYLDLGRNALVRSSYQEALTYFHLALCTVVGHIDPDNVWEDPSRTDPNNYRSLKTLTALKANAWKGLYDLSQDTSYLNQAIRLYELADYFATKNRTDASYQKSRLRYSEENMPVYEGCIDAYVELYIRFGSPQHLHRAFLLMEKSKSLTLLEDLLEANAFKGSDLPTHIQHEERAFQDSLANLRSAILTTPDSIREQLEHIRVRIELAYDQFKSQLEKEYPRYYQSKYAFHFQSIPEVQQLLNPDQELLEYFTGTEYVFLFHITKNAQHVYRTKRPKSLNHQISNLITSLTNFDISRPIEDSANSTNINQYIDQAKTLYELLLGSIDFKSDRRYTFVPDGVLNYIPFGALLRSKPDDPTNFSTYPYLERHITISYNYSATLQRQMVVQSIEEKGQVLCLAPEFTDVVGLHPLLYNEREVDEISKIMAAKKLIGGDASLIQFMQQVPNFDIFHFATHAQVDDEDSDYSYLAFSQNDDTDRHLYLADLYQKFIPAQLVTLSACETNRGPVQDGEGIASLAKGFSYAGAKSIVTSLWEIEDQATMSIMKYFYENLKSGMQKDEALKTAKLHYLDSQKGPFAHPFFWSAYVPIGDMSPLVFKGRWSYLLIGLCLTIFFGITVYFKRKLTRNKS